MCVCVGGWVIAIVRAWGSSTGRTNRVILLSLSIRTHHIILCSGSRHSTIIIGDILAQSVHRHPLHLPRPHHTATTWFAFWVIRQAGTRHMARDEHLRTLMQKCIILKKKKQIRQNRLTF